MRICLSANSSDGKIPLTGQKLQLKIPVSAPDAKSWSVDDPNLYVCEVELSEGKNWVDKDSRRFGFRWFEASGIGDDAVFRLGLYLMKHPLSL